MSDFFIEFSENRKEEINEQFLRYQEENRITEEDNLKQYEISKKQRLNPNYLHKKTMRHKDKGSFNQEQKNNRIENKNLLLLDIISNNFSEESENETLKKLNKLIKKKYDMSLRDYVEIDNKYYTELIRGEENYMDATISKINEFSMRKKFPDFYKEKEKDNDKESGNENYHFPSVNKKDLKDSFFFITFNDDQTKESICNYLKNVPYVCPFPSCNRKFFLLKNLEEHTH
jgi:hypothetical protein